MKFWKKIRVEEIFRKFYIKFGKSLQKIYGISKLISRTFENKNFVIMKSRSSRNILYFLCILFSPFLTDNFFQVMRPFALQQRLLPIG